MYKSFLAKFLSSSAAFWKYLSASSNEDSGGEAKRVAATFLSNQPMLATPKHHLDQN
jgi:hypothetical protein